jgi:hypothetical protein
MTLVGCAEAMFKGYAGPEKPVELLAVVRLHGAAATVEPLLEDLPTGERKYGIRIYGLDGKRVSTAAPRIAVEPGAHVFDLVYYYEDATNYDRWGRRATSIREERFLLSADLEAGRSYLIDAFKSLTRPNEVELKITDTTTRKPVRYSVEYQAD